MSAPHESYSDNAANLASALPVPVERLAHGLHHLGLESLDAISAHRLIAEATPETALAALDYVNAAVTGDVERPDHAETTSSVASTIDGQQVVSQLLLAPRHRMDLMGYVLARATQADGPNRMANIMAYGTVLAHHFADGNGRTARVVGAMIAEGFDPHSTESVANIEQAATSRDAMAVRIASFVPDISMKRSWIAEHVDADQTIEAYKDAEGYTAQELSSYSDEKSRSYVDGNKIEAMLHGVQDQDTRLQLQKTIQQNGFGSLAIVDACTMTGESVQNVLGAIDDTVAERIITLDEDRKLAYSKYIIDIAAGESKPYYFEVGSEKDDTIKITDQYMIGYH